MEWMLHPDAWAAFLALTALEIVLGIDNLVFLSIVAERLPAEQQAKARTIGLLLALVGRIALLLSISWVMGLVEPMFVIAEHQVSGRDLVLLGGGAFLIYKATREIHEEVEGPGTEFASVSASATFGAALAQIFLLDLVFSLDSVITAVGMAERVSVMVTAIVVAMIFMIAAAKSVSAFIRAHPTVKMLALSFLLLVGVALLADGLHQHLPRGYIYAAMAFSIFVETLNMRRRKAVAPGSEGEPTDGPAN